MKYSQSMTVGKELDFEGRHSQQCRGNTVAEGDQPPVFFLNRCCSSKAEPAALQSIKSIKEMETKVGENTTSRRFQRRTFISRSRMRLVISLS